MTGPPRLRGLVGWATIVLIVGLVVAVTGLVAVIGRAGSGLLADFNAPVVSTPTDFTRTFDPGTYLVFERTGTSRQLGPLTTTQDTGVSLTAAQVVITATDGTTIAVGIPAGDETLTRGTATFMGAARFVITSQGRYRVTVTAPGLYIVVAPSITSSLGRALAWLALVGIGALLGILGGVLLAVGLVRRGRGAAPDGGPAGGGWFADPWRQGALRYWDGHSWTGHIR